VSNRPFALRNAAHLLSSATAMHFRAVPLTRGYVLGRNQCFPCHKKRSKYPANITLHLAEEMGTPRALARSCKAFNFPCDTRNTGFYIEAAAQDVGADGVVTTPGTALPTAADYWRHGDFAPGTSITLGSSQVPEPSNWNTGMSRGPETFERGRCSLPVCPLKR
jgi:hypothetical protein